MLYACSYQHRTASPRLVRGLLIVGGYSRCVQTIDYVTRRPFYYRDETPLLGNVSHGEASMASARLYVHAARPF